MEWIETTGKTVDEAKEAALDQLGVGPDEAEFEILESPRPGLFGRLRGEARVRSRVRPTEVRPKPERRRRSDKKSGGGRRDDARPTRTDDARPTTPDDGAAAETIDRSGEASADAPGGVAVDERSGTPEEVGEAALAFVDGLIEAFGLTATSKLVADGVDLEVAVSGSDLGLLIGPGGHTLLSIQNLARVSAQRRLGDHETRLRVDVAGYREKRRLALEAFALRVAAEVRETGTARSLEPMTSSDRKVIHDVLNGEQGVVSHSEGEDPARRVVVTPAP
jgi:spoIIIJ-associated protein